MKLHELVSSSNVGCSCQKEMGQSLSHVPFHVILSIASAPSALIRFGDGESLGEFFEALLEKYSGREAILYRKVCEAPDILETKSMAHGISRPLGHLFLSTRVFVCQPERCETQITAAARPTSWIPASFIRIQRHGNSAADLFGVVEKCGKKACNPSFQAAIAP